MRSWLNSIPEQQIILSSGTESWDKAALLKKISQVSEALLNRKNPKAPVGVLADNSLEWIDSESGENLGIAGISLAQVVVVPALSVDATGMRIGQGGGSYDRALKLNSGWKVCLLHDGEIFEGDVAIVCPGADHTSLFKDQLDTAPIRRVRLQMMSTAPLDEVLTTSIADGDSMRYYPGYEVPTVENLPPQHPIASSNHMQLLMVQRADGSLTIGDTHEYAEPFEFKLDEDPYTYLHDVASNLLGKKLPPIAHRWDGVYSQVTDGGICDRRAIAQNIISVTGPGGRGNTLAPAIAEETIKGL